METQEPKMHRTAGRILTLLVAVLVLTASAAAGLREEVQRLVRTTELGGATVAVSIREADGGTPLVDINARQQMIPASNMKLLTTGAALHTLGPDFRFQTKMLLDGDRLVIVGDGDPAFADPNLLELMGTSTGEGMDLESFLGLWVRPVVDAAGGRISEIIVDDRVFDRQFVHPSWDRAQLNTRSFAEAAGLSFHLNVLHFYPAPRSGHRPSLTRFQPRANWLEIRNRGTSDSGPGASNTAWFARAFQTNTLTFYGNVKHAYRDPVPVTVHNAPSFFGQVLADRLRVGGLSVGSTRVAEANETFVGATSVGPVIHTPIDTIIARCNRDSQNLYAECLLKRMGHELTGQPGSWPNGASIIRHAVHDRLGDPALSALLSVADGSGLSRENRVAPAAMTAWLASFHQDEQLASPFIESLAVGGVSGTLRAARRPGLSSSRVSGATVQAKSGYINQVSCLSGYVTMPDGRRRCFSIMVNNLRAPVRRAKDLQDKIVQAVAKDMARQTTVLGSD
jgi:D-alanyl-D-alanine carboxypeptidase/D-alanyl-D-alanine-endopeptidase (penicillin-binding protein 4)